MFLLYRMRWTVRMVESFFLDSLLATFKTGPSLSERLFPRPANGVTGEEGQESPPLLEVRSYLCSVVHKFVFRLLRRATKLLKTWHGVHSQIL